jgi:hypothetical protein
MWIAFMRVCCDELQVVAKRPSWASIEYEVWIADRQFTCRTLNGSGVELSRAVFIRV